MSLPTEAVLDFLAGGGFFWVLLAGLAATLALAGYAWRRAASDAVRELLVASATLTACALLWSVFAALFRLGHLPARLWMAPFDRLIAAVCLIALGWTLTASRSDSVRFRRFLGAALLATVLAYAGWAPLWARELHLQPWLASDPTGLSRAWDAWTVALALAVGAVFVRNAARPSGWIVAALAGLTLGSLFELVLPLSADFPAWSRLGTLLAGAMVLGAAGRQAFAPFAPSLVDGWRRLRHARFDAAPLRAARPVPAPEVVSDLALEVAPDIFAEEALRLVVTHLGASPAFIGLLTPAGDLEVRVLGGIGREPRRIGAFPLADLPTLARALGEGRILLRSSRLAQDLHRLYALVSADDGAVLLQRIGGDRALGVLVAGRPRTQWEAHDQVQLATIASTVAGGLEAGAAARATTGEVTRVLGALEAQATAVNRLTRSVEGLARRLGELESTVIALQAPGSQAATASQRACATAAASVSAPQDGLLDGGAVPSPSTDAAVDRAVEAVLESGAAVDAAASTTDAAGDRARPVDAPADVAVARAPADETRRPPADERARDEIAGRVPRYERALERLPWGVLVIDAAGAVAFANAAAARLLHLREIAAGTPAAAVFPDPERIEIALHRARARVTSEAAPERRPLEVRFESPLLRVELDPLSDPALGYLGAVAVVDHAAPSRIASDEELVRGLTDALRTPMTMILGYSDLLTRSSGVNDEHVERFLQRIDANLARMQVMLSNLLTVIEIERTTAAPQEPQPVDVAQVLQHAVGRARAQFAEKGLAVRLAVDGPFPMASADPAALQQIVDNLLVNATARSPQGGDITVGLEVREDIGTRAMVISVHDRGVQLQGVGGGVVEIDEAQATPVALRVVRLLTNRQGGRAWIESDPRGSRFYVRLPLRKAA